nr:MAG TPA: hypothetical protein [Caudoviricetes sp.]
MLCNNSKLFVSKSFSNFTWNAIFISISKIILFKKER